MSAPKKHRLSRLLGKKDSNDRPSPINQDSAYASSENQENIVQVENDGVIPNTKENQNLALNRSTGEVFDEDTGEVVTVVTTTTTTTTTTTSSGGRKQQETSEDVQTTQHQQPVGHNPLAMSGGSTTSSTPGRSTHTIGNHPSGGAVQYDNPRSTNAGPHSSNMMNKVDPRVDSDRDGRNAPLTTATGGFGHYDNPRSTNAGPHSSNMMNKADPRVDSDRDGRNAPMSTNTGGVGQYDNPHSTNAGPHSSNLMNKADPRVDSDRDGRNAPMAGGAVPVHDSTTHPRDSGAFIEPNVQHNPHTGNTAEPLSPSKQNFSYPSRDDTTRKGSKMADLKAAAIGLHGVGETLRGTLNSAVDANFPRKNASKMTKNEAKNQAALDRGRTEMSGINAPRAHDSAFSGPTHSEVPHSVSHNPTNPPLNNPSGAADSTNYPAGYHPPRGTAVRQDSEAAPTPVTGEVERYTSTREDYDDQFDDREREKSSSISKMFKRKPVSTAGPAGGGDNLQDASANRKYY